jgi:hypothetical protein
VRMMYLNVSEIFAFVCDSSICICIYDFVFV